MSTCQDDNLRLRADHAALTLASQPTPEQERALLLYSDAVAHFEARWLADEYFDRHTDKWVFDSDPDPISAWEEQFPNVPPPPPPDDAAMFLPSSK